MMKNQARHITQPAAVAGIFYPAEPQALAHEVDQYLFEAQSAASVNKPQDRPIKALIVPHAGYTYSGGIAAQAYAQLLPRAKEIRRVIVFAPAHRLPFKGLATTSADSFSTPLGKIRIDATCRNKLSSGELPVQILDEAFREEHALEVQLPFLQRLLEEFTLLPILVGDADPVQIQNVMQLCWGGPETLIVVSSDLSHFHDYDTADQIDRHTTMNIEALQADQLGFESACGRIPISGLLLAARDKDLQVETVARCNSGDTGGDRQRVVGYGAYVFH